MYLVRLLTCTSVRFRRAEGADGLAVGVSPCSKLAIIHVAEKVNINGATHKQLPTRSLPNIATGAASTTRQGSSTSWRTRDAESILLISLTKASSRYKSEDLQTTGI